MAGSLSNFAEAKVLNHLTGEVDWPLPTVYVGLFKDDPGEAGALDDEVADLYAYARVAVSGKWAAASGGSVEINAEIAFPEADGGDWGTITHFALLNGNTHGAGNILVSGTITTPKTIEDGEIAKFESGDITVTLTDVFDYRDKILDHVVGEADITDIACWLALFVDAVEVSQTGYARVATDSDDWNTATEGSISNVADIAFPEAGADWGTVNKFKLMDAETTGAAIAHGDLGSSKHIESGETAKFAGGAPGDLVLNLS